MDRIFNVEPRQPGDLTAEEIGEHYEISEETVRVKFKTLVNKGKYARMRVQGPDGKVITVYRKRK